MAPCYHVFTGYHDHSQGAYPSTAHIPKSICLNVRFATIPCTKSLFLEGTKHVVPLAWVWDRGA